MRLVLAAAAVLTVALPMGAFAQPPTYLTSWATTGIPLGLAVDAAQRVYVVDELSPAYQMFDLNGNLLATQGGGFEEYGVHVCPDATILVSNYYGRFVRRYDSAGAILNSWSTGGVRALDLALDAAENVYVTDDEDDAVRKFSPAGVPLAQWGAPHPAGVAHFAGRIYVAGMFNGMMQIFDTNGVPQGSFPTGATWAEQLTVDALGRLYLADTGTNTLRCFDPDGTLRWTLGPVVPGYPFAVADVFSVALVGDGTILVGDYTNRRVLVLRETPVPALPISWGSMKDRYRE
jgi:DNA-binding beta-propeller fold protein YncE